MYIKNVSGSLTTDVATIEYFNHAKAGDVIACGLLKELRRKIQ
jgi:hypothetical protein